MPRISVKYEADPSVNPVYVRVYDPVARVGNIQKAYLATASHRGTLNFRGIEYPRNNQKEFIAFNNGMEIEISAVERTEYPGTEGGVLVSYFPLGSPTRMVLSC
jgi:hypothetical protein